MCYKFGKCEYCVQDEEVCAELGTGQPLCFMFICENGEKCEDMPCVSDTDFLPFDF